jgi:DNA-binding NarL/FixJ family response regulator
LRRPTHTCSRPSGPRADWNADIAAELYMSVATVKAHVSRQLTKLEAGNRVQIALLAHDAGVA